MLLILGRCQICTKGHFCTEGQFCTKTFLHERSFLHLETLFHKNIFAHHRFCTKCCLKVPKDTFAGEKILFLNCLL